MIYYKDKIDMSLVLAPYEECNDFINIKDEYTNNLLRLSGVSDIDLIDYVSLCIRGDFVEYLLDYATKSARHAYYYAKRVLKGRFQLGEPIIATNVEFSYYYARDVLKGRFELGEQAIASDGGFKNRYFELTGIEL